MVISSLYFLIAGVEKWQWLAVFWSIIPLMNVVYFSQVPLSHVDDGTVKANSFKELLSNRLFWIMVLIMVGAGASEQAVSQWMSAFAESGLGLSKEFSDLTGPLIFAVAMGIARVLYGKYGERIPLKPFMAGSALLCFASYFIIALSPWPVLAIVGCALAGFSVGIMWPGTFSLAAIGIPRGSTMMYAFLALAGDIGCAVGPTVVGVTAGMFDNQLQIGFLIASIFPILLVLGIYLNGRKKIQSIN